MTDPVLEQLQVELTHKLSAVALLDPAIARAATTDCVSAGVVWHQILTSAGDPRLSVLEDFVDALWPDGAPLDWWQTPLGALVASKGYDPDQMVSKRDAMGLLGWSKYRVEKHFGGEIELRDVLDLVVQDF